MLILSRHERETVRFPELDITVRVAKCGASTVRLGIEAPRSIRVVRGELEPLEPTQESAWQARRLSAKSSPAQAGNHPQSDRQAYLEQAQLALRLAENQLRQQRTEHAQRAIEQALAELDRLECALAQVECESGLPQHAANTEPGPATSAAGVVREPGSAYRTSAPERFLVGSA